VDGFQGREKEVIVLCTVRNNRQNQLGFVADPRRLNVAITRANRGLIVLGHRDTLSTDQLWQKWLQFVDKYECEVESADVFLDES
jgi:regulator of nonsense transcripts 1